MKNYSFNYDFNGSPIDQRQSDGYVNLTQMVKAGDPDKKLNNYLRQESLKPYLEEVSKETGISVIKLTEVKTGRYGGTWGHPLVADRLKVWLSNRRKKVVGGFVYIYLDPGNNAYKIGFTTKKEGRERQHKTSNPFLELVAIYEVSGIEVEQAIHLALAKYRIRGTTEWYVKEPKVLSITALIVNDFSRGN
jgi:hypothetical protein